MCNSRSKRLRFGLFAIASRQDNRSPDADQSAGAAAAPLWPLPQPYFDRPTSWTCSTLKVVWMTAGGQLYMHDMMIILHMMHHQNGQQ